MKRMLFLSLALLLGLHVSARAGGFLCLNCGIHCQCPEPYCPDCSCPCEHGLRRCTEWKCARSHRLIEELCAPDCCTRITAARQLGHRWQADFCCSPEVLDALLRALLCDSCWEVRRAAAWSLAMQDARVETAVLALYLAAKLDPHYLVRDKANDALDVMLVCRKKCYKELFLAADALVKQLRGRYRPGPGCVELVNGCAVACGISLGAPVSPPAGGPANPTIPPDRPMPEKLPSAPIPGR